MEDYWNTLEKGACSLHNDPYNRVILIEVQEKKVDWKKILDETKALILTQPQPDWEGFVWNCLLSDGGDAGAEHYEIKAKDFKLLVLRALDEICSGKF